MTTVEMPVFIMAKTKEQLNFVPCESVGSTIHVDRMTGKYYVYHAGYRGFVIHRWHYFEFLDSVSHYCASPLEGYTHDWRERHNLERASSHRCILQPSEDGMRTVCVDARQLDEILLKIDRIWYATELSYKEAGWDIRR